VASSRPRLATPDVEERLRARFGEDISELVDSFGQTQVSIAVSRYRELAAVLRDDPAFGCDYFDFVTAVDYPEDGEFEVVAQLHSLDHNHGIRIKARIPREEPRCPTIHDLYPGAAWAEREVWELFGIVFDGHPHLVKLVLPEPFEGHPLRKDFTLMSREAKVWPGAAEGEEAEE
jgi:NADH-quinone oxidoreductase subunit C